MSPPEMQIHTDVTSVCKHKIILISTDVFAVYLLCVCLGEREAERKTEENEVEI